MSFSVDQEIAFLKHEKDRFQKLVICSNCGVNQKEKVLPCGHLFCDACIQNQISSRRRECPIDRRKFTNLEPKKIYLTDAAEDETME
jgi:E3 ubiquitin-protein ligase BRE1